MSNTTKLLIVIACIWILNIFDGIATLYAIREGYAVEGNPIMDVALSKGALNFFLIKMGLVTLGAVGIFLAHSKYRAIYKLLLPVAGVYGLIACLHVYGFLFVR